MKNNLLLLCALLMSTLFVTAQTEFEPNNTILQNTSLNTLIAPDTMSAYITSSSNADSVDFFKIILPYSGTWKFNIINTNGTPCLMNMRLYNAQNISDIIISSSGINFDFNAGIPGPVILNCGQEIYVRIDQISGTDIGNYFLEVVPDLTSLVNDPWEPNNNYSEAVLLPIDTAIANTIWGYDCDGNGDRDIFKVIAPQCGVLNVTADNIGAGTATQDIRITVYQPDSLTPIGNTGNGCNASSVTGSYLVQPGAIYIQITDNTGNNGSCQGWYDLSDIPFNLNLNFDITDSCECNNSFATACPIGINSTQQLKLWGLNSTMSLLGSEDRDFYSTVAPHCGVLNISATGIGGGGGTSQDVRITVYQPDSLTPIGNTGNGCNSDVSGSYLVQPGNIYIKIDDNTGNNGSCQGGYDLSDIPFQLNLNFDTSDSCECNNTFATACQVQPNSTHTAKLWGLNSTLSILGSEDRDYYSILIPQCSQLTVTAANIGGGGNTTQDIKITVYQPDSLTSIGNTGNGCNATSVTGTYNVQAGIAYIKIDDNTGNSGSCQGGYDLSDISYNVSFIVSNCTGISELSNAIQFSVIPNPVKNNLKIELSEQNNLQSSVSIIDLLGKKLYHKKIANQSKLTIDVTDLPSGIYFVQISNENGKGLTKKFIKE